MKPRRSQPRARGTSCEHHEGTHCALIAERMGVWEADVASGRLTASGAMASAFGVTPEQAPATVDELLARVHPQDRAAVEDRLLRTIREGRGFTDEFRTIWPDQTVHWIAGRAMLVRAAGAPARLVGVVMDVTDFNRADEERRFQAARTATERELTLDGIVVVDRRGRLVSFNRRFAEMWRLSDAVVNSRQEAAVFGAVRDRVRRPDAFMEKIRYLDDHRDESSRDEVDLLDGRTFDRYSAPIREADGPCLGRVWYFRDVTADRALCPFIPSMRACERHGVWGAEVPEPTK